MHLTRTAPRFLAASVAIAALALTGCAASDDTSSSEGSDSTGAFPVSFESLGGTTTIESKPERVVTLGWGSTEAAIALGVIPVAIDTQSYTAPETGVVPWVEEALEEAGAETPTLLTVGDDLPYEEIAEADPDVILAPYSGVTAEQFELLSEIAPVVGNPEAVWTTPWRDVITMVGEALGDAEGAQDILDGIDADIAAAAEEHPEFAGKTIAAVYPDPTVFSVYTDKDPRVQYLFDFGFVTAPSVAALDTGDTFYYTLSQEQLDQLDADVILSYAADETAQADFLAAGYAQLIPAVQTGAVAEVSGTAFVSSVSPPTALSASWGLEDLVAQLSKAALAADAAQ